MSFDLLMQYFMLSDLSCFIWLLFMFIFGFRKHTLGDNYFGANPFVAPVTYSNFYNGNATGFQKASGGLTHTDRVGFEDILNHTQSITRRFEEVCTDFPLRIHSSSNNMAIIIPC